MRGVALLAGSLGIHVVALAALPAIFPSTQSTPLFVDLATLDQAATGPAGDGSAGAGVTTRGDGVDRRTAKAPARAPHSTATPPSAATQAAPMPAPSAPTEAGPAPTPSPIVSPAPPPTSPPAAPTPRSETPPARPPVAASPGAMPSEPGTAPAALPADADDRPAPGGSRDVGRGTRSDGPGEATGSTTSGAGASSLALARPGAGPGAAGTVPPEYAAYLARFRQRVEEAIVYPLAARRQGRGGRVELDVRLEPSGRVTRVDVVTSSDRAALDAAAVDAVKAVEAIPFPASLPRRPLIVRIPLVFQLR
jgi:periplasmic protein TonB